jgi:hypothetical protein
MPGEISSYSIALDQGLKVGLELRHVAVRAGGEDRVVA